MTQEEKISLLEEMLDLSGGTLKTGTELTSID